MLISFLDGVINIVGSIITSTTRGIPRIAGILKEANRFWFILDLKLFCVFVFWLILMMGWCEK